MRVCVVTVSDRASSGVYEDESGPEIERILTEGPGDVVVEREIVPDEIDAIVASFARHLEADFILTTGGTGLSSRDVTSGNTTVL